MGELATFLNHLIAVDYDAIEAYEAAIARIADAHDKATLEHFCDDHRRHVSELSNAVRVLGGTPVDHTDFRHFLQTGKVVVGGLLGTDDGVIRAMRSNEDDTNAAYERAVAHPDLPRDVRSVLDRGLDDERRHRDWLEKRIGLTPKGEPVVTAFVREVV